MNVLGRIMILRRDDTKSVFDIPHNIRMIAVANVMMYWFIRCEPHSCRPPGARKGLLKIVGQ